MLSVLTLFLIPIGGGIPAGVLLARDRGISWPVAMGLYFISDVILAFCFEPVLRLLISLGRKIPRLARVTEAVRAATARTAAHYGGAGAGPLALVMIAFGVDPMTGRAAAAAAGHGFLSGWAIAIAGDMIYYTVIMLATLQLNSVLGDPNRTMAIILAAMFVVPILARKFKGPRVVTLSNEDSGFSFRVAPASGGELSSVKIRHQGRSIELLHRADRFSGSAKGWRGRAPWLFPAVGRSYHVGRGNAYALDGRVYAMPMHGFVMDRPWELVSAGPRAVVCRLRSDAATRALYPFDFELTAAYAMRPGGLSARVEVLAADSNSRPMPFSIGNHITLAVPLSPGSDPGACEVRSPAARILELDHNGLLTGESAPAPYARGVLLREDPRLFDGVIAGFPSGQAWVELRDPSGLAVRVEQKADAGAENFRFVFYSDGGRTFFCPEPWCGEPDSLNTGRGLLRLAPGERFGWELTLTIS